ncbi:hypothetical protein DFH07DRAFT_775295 [Mycena maculata]|uniref:Uncharacterized protein n=1 Tax=Mycena maculata TaxID=230809 RepID=A0AAD7N7X7_9AGAR|nr:hypothetical protein DFH07DRAFT_775295 [Mycena maculata]
MNTNAARGLMEKNPLHLVNLLWFDKTTPFVVMFGVALHLRVVKILMDIKRKGNLLLIFFDLEVIALDKNGFWRDMNAQEIQLVLNTIPWKRLVKSNQYQTRLADQAPDQ